MIDAHCHLEWRAYDKDREEVIARCRKQLKAVIMSCSRPQDFEKALEIAEKNSNFVFMTAGFHPEFMKVIPEEQQKAYLEKIRQNKEKLVAIGEIGLDYDWIQEPEARERSKELFKEMLDIARELDLPAVIHSRAAHKDVLDILEKHAPQKILLHMWGGHQKELMEHVNSKDYFVSVNTILFTSKGYKKVVRDVPLERLLLETDAPWLALKKMNGSYRIDSAARNEPTSIRLVAERIAEIKKLDFEQVWRTCGRNAIRFYSLPL